MLIIKSIRNLTVMILTVLLATGCLQKMDDENNETSASFSRGPVSLSVHLGGSSRAERFLGSFDEISRLALDVHREFDGAQVVNDLELTQQNGVWKGTLNNMIISFQYDITGHAYKTADNGSLIEIFRGTTTKLIESDNISLTLRLAPLLDDRELSVPRITRINRPFQMEKDTSETLQISFTNIDKELVQYRFRSLDEQNSLPLSAEAGGSFAPATGVQQDNGSGYSDITTVYTAPDAISVQHLQVRVSNDLEIGVSSTFNTYVTGPIDSATTVDTNPVIESISAERLADSSLQWSLLVSDDEDFNRMVAHWEYYGGASWMRTFDNPVYTAITDDSRNDLGLGRIETVMQGYLDSDDGILRVTVCEDMPGHSGSCVYGAEGSTTITMELIPYAYQKPIICDGTDCSSNQIVDADNKVPRFLSMDVSGGAVTWENAPEASGNYIPVYEAPQSRFVYSSDGFSWQDGPENPEIELRQTPAITPMTSLVLYDGSQYLALEEETSGRWIYRSSDGSEWDHVGDIGDNNTPLSFVSTVDNASGTYQFTEELDSLIHLVYGDGTYLGIAEKILPHNTQDNPYISTGYSYYLGRDVSPSEELYKCRYNQHGANLYTIYGTSNSYDFFPECQPTKEMQTIVSSDGINWSPGSVNVSVLVDNGSGYDNVAVVPTDVVFDGGDFVGIGDSTLIKSSDGISWSHLGSITGSGPDGGFQWVETSDNGTTDNMTLGRIDHLLYGNGKYLAIAVKEFAPTGQSPYRTSGYSDYLQRQVDYSEGLFHCRYNQQGVSMYTIYGTSNSYDFFPECQWSEQLQSIVSADGTTWTPENGNPDVKVLIDNATGGYDNVTFIPDAFAFHNGKFLGFDDQMVIQSTDGLAWSAVGSKDSFSVDKLLTANGKLVSFSITQAFNDYCQHPSTGSWGNWPECSGSIQEKIQIRQSGDDGLTWSSLNDDVKVTLEYTTEARFQPRHIVFGSNRFLAVLDSTVESGLGTHTAIGSSEDGLKWGYWGSFDRGLLDEKLSGISHISYGDGRYVAVAAAKGGMKNMYIPSLNSWNNVYVDDLMQTFVSDDGAAWTLGNDEVELNLPGGGVGPIIPTAMTYGDGEFLATDGSLVISSADGISWSTKGSFSEELPIAGLSYGGGKYVALAQGGEVGYIRSYDSWSNTLSRTVYPSENLWWCSNDADGNYLGSEDAYDECQDTNEIWSSSGGVSWQQETFGVTLDNGTVENAAAQVLVHGDGGFFAYDNASIMTSINGHDWSRDDNASDHFHLPSDNFSYGLVLDNLTSSATTSMDPLRVVRIGPSTEPGYTGTSNVTRTRARKVFVTFNRPVKITQNGSSYGSSTESCENFDVQYYQTSNESSCYRWSYAPSPYGESVWVDGTQYAETWVFYTGSSISNYYYLRIRVKSSSTLVDQSGIGLSEDFVSGQIRTYN